MAFTWFVHRSSRSIHTAGQASSGTQAFKEFLFRSVPELTSKLSKTDPIWQVQFYSFEIYTAGKIEEKLNDMHLNRVRAGLVERPMEWLWGSARWYVAGRTVGIPIQWVD